MKVMLLAAGAAFTLLAAQPALARDDSAPTNTVSCIKNRIKEVDRALLVKVVKAGYQVTGSDEKEVMVKVGTAVDYCRTKNGWGKARQDAALRYMSARVLRDDAIFRGNELGLTEPVLDAIVGKITVESRPKFAEGQMNPTLSAELSAALQAAGLDFAKVSADDKPKLAALVRQGVQSTIIEQDATTAYTKP